MTGYDKNPKNALRSNHTLMIFIFYNEDFFEKCRLPNSGFHSEPCALIPSRNSSSKGNGFDSLIRPKFWKSYSIVS